MRAVSLLALPRYLITRGAASATRRPRIASTTSSSTSVKPFGLRYRIVVDTMMPATKMQFGDSSGRSVGILVRWRSLVFIAGGRGSQPSHDTQGGEGGDGAAVPRDLHVDFVGQVYPPGGGDRRDGLRQGDAGGPAIAVVDVAGAL